MSRRQAPLWLGFSCAVFLSVEALLAKIPPFTMARDPNRAGRRKVHAVMNKLCAGEGAGVGPRPSSALRQLVSVSYGDQGRCNTTYTRAMAARTSTVTATVERWRVNGPSMISSPSLRSFGCSAAVLATISLWLYTHPARRLRFLHVRTLLRQIGSAPSPPPESAAK